MFILQKAFYSGHHESVNFSIDFENQGTTACLFNSVMQTFFSLSSLQIYIEQSSHYNQVTSLI